MTEAERRAKRFRRFFPEAHCVKFVGPEAAQDIWGDWFPIWHVYYADEDGEYLEHLNSYTIHSYEKAKNLAETMAEEKGLELVPEAQSAGRW